MKLTGALKEKVEKAENAAQAKEFIAAAGLELTDDELENVTGGTYTTIGGIFTGKKPSIPVANPVVTNPVQPGHRRIR